MKYKTILKYTILFSLFLFYNVYVIEITADEMWNYGFSINMYNGLIPYTDFNMVITPFFNFLFSLPFHIFGKNILVFHIEQAILLTITSYILFKLLNKKAYLVLSFLIWPGKLIGPSYNYFCFFLVLLIVYLEILDNESYDFIIGILIGFSILTKQTVGIFMILPSIFTIYKKKRIIRRIIYASIPCIIFLIYLIATNSLGNFLDLCIFGLIDFGKQNSIDILRSRASIMNILAIFFVIISMVITLLKLYKNIGNKIVNIYVLLFFSMTIPSLNTYHLNIFIALFLVVIMYDINIDFLNYKLLFISIYIITCLFYIYATRFYIKSKYVYPNDINNLQFKYINSKNIRDIKKVASYIKKNEKKNRKVYILSNEGYLYKIVSNSRLSYLDLINTGNAGYNGTYKMINRIKNTDNTLFLINPDDFAGASQTDKKIIKYVIKNTNKIGKIYYFDIYYKE